MQVIKWIFIVSIWTLIAAFFHYTLPQKDIVRITDTYEKRIDFGENSIFWASPDAGNSEATVNRDVFFIQTRRADDSVMVYRNEDTGWSWPPYFKFDTSNLHAEAGDLKSTVENPKWALLTHYGWRNEFLSIFPNAISVKQIEGPDIGKPIPWLNIVIIGVFLFVSAALFVRWRRFRERRLDPALEEIQGGLEATGDAISERQGRFRRWLNTWRR